MRRVVLATITVCLAVSLLHCTWLPQEETPAVTAKQLPTIKTVKKEKITIEQMSERSLLPFGYWTQASEGDYVLENDRFWVVISNVAQELRGLPTGGIIIDILKKGKRVDYFGNLQPNIQSDAFGKTRYGKVYTSDEEYGEGAALVVEGYLENQPKIKITNEYIVEPGASYLKIRTTVVNATSAPLQLEPGDFVRWGGDQLFVGNFGVPPYTERTESSCEWLGGYIYDHSVGVTIAAGEIEAQHHYNESKLVYGEASVAPEDSYTYERFLIVSDEDLGGISEQAWKLRGVPVGYIAGRVLDDQTNEPVRDVQLRVTVSRLDGEPVPNRPFTMSTSLEDGSYKIALPPGSFFLRAVPASRFPPKVNYSVSITAGGSHMLDIRVSPPTLLKYQVEDAETGDLLPCKLTFLTPPGAQPVDFGSFYDFPGSRNIYYAYEGKGEIEIKPGKYRVIVSRGPEYNMVQEEFDLGSIQTKELKVKLRRVVNTPGYVAADLAVRTSNSSDTSVSPEERLLAAVCEGVELVVSADNSVATDLSPWIEKYNLGGLIKAVKGVQLRHPQFGSFLLFPVSAVSPESIEELKGAGTPSALFSSMRSYFPDALITVLDPFDADSGYFQQFGFTDATTEVPKGFALDFDLISLWRGKRMQSAGDALSFYRELMKNGTLLHPVGASQSSSLYGEETGYPRVFIKSSTDEPSQIQIEEMVASLKAGKYVVSNGPFVLLSVDDQPIGSLVEAKEGEAKALVEVFAPNWVDTYHLVIYQQGEFSRASWFMTARDEVKRYPRKEGEGRFFNLRVKEDCVVYVEIRGRGTLEPVVSSIAYPESTAPSPLALTGPVFIDGDGDGQFTMQRIERE